MQDGRDRDSRMAEKQGSKGTDRLPEHKHRVEAARATGAREKQGKGMADEEMGLEGQDRQEAVGTLPARCRPQGPGQVAELPPGGCCDPQPTLLDTQSTVGQGATAMSRRPHL